MLSLEDARSRIEKKINETLFPATPAQLYDPVRYILSIGGKRIRPSLVLLGANVFDDNIEPALDAAVAIEIFHNFTLLHDDLMDNSKIRRGKETVHEKWNPNIAILSGDTMSIIANQFVSRVNPDILPDVLKVFNQTAVEVCEGQMMDMTFEKREDVSVEEYIKMIELKTSVLIAASLKIGAYIGGANHKEANEMYEYGRLLGIAFQIQDDLLDSYGDTETFGKKVGNDIVSNKKTYLMISAMEQSGKEDLDALKSWLNNKDFDPENKIREVKKIYDRYNIKALTLDKTREYFDSARAVLEKIVVSEERKIVLEAFSNTLMKRKV